MNGASSLREDAWECDACRDEVEAVAGVCNLCPRGGGALRKKLKGAGCMQSACSAERETFAVSSSPSKSLTGTPRVSTIYCLAPADCHKSWFRRTRVRNFDAGGWADGSSHVWYLITNFRS
eukprot:SM000058S18477  [mRNA]  locus=s58:97930:98472:+ [translate_table: standard]